MANEEAIKNELTQKFGYLNDKIRIQRERRIFADVPLTNFMEVFDHLVKKMDFSTLVTITGLDEGENLAFLYHLAKRDGTMFNLKTFATKNNPVIKTVVSYFPVAENYERELVDMLGAKVEGLKEGRRYPLPEDWPVGQYPLRKDWKKETLDDMVGSKMQKEGK